MLITAYLAAAAAWLYGFAVLDKARLRYRSGYGFFGLQHAAVLGCALVWMPRKVRTGTGCKVRPLPYALTGACNI